MRKWPLIAGIALVIVGFLGMAATAAVSMLDDSEDRDGSDTRYEERRDRDGRGPGFRDDDLDERDFDSRGERIYLTGATEERRIPRQGDFVRMHLDQAGCAGCHGEDGKGGVTVYGRTESKESPDIRYKTLTSPHEEEGERGEGWNDAQIAEAVRDGVEPGGEELSGLMPRWDMRDSEMEDLIDHMKELD